MPGGVIVIFPGGLMVICHARWRRRSWSRRRLLIVMTVPVLPPARHDELCVIFFGHAGELFQKGDGRP